LFRQGFALHELSNLFIEISMWIGRNRIHWWINYPVLELMETLDLTRKSPFCVFRLLWFVCCLWLLERERERERKCWWWWWRNQSVGGFDGLVLFDNHSFFGGKIILINYCKANFTKSSIHTFTFWLRKLKITKSSD
jgi:hypothetical protein